MSSMYRAQLWAKHDRRARDVENVDVPRAAFSTYTADNNADLTFGEIPAGGGLAGSRFVRQVKRPDRELNPALYA